MTASQSRNKNVKTGPREIGQLKSFKLVRLNFVTIDDLKKRIDQAEELLETGKVPKSAKGGSPATKDPTLSKARGDLTKANNKLDDAKKRITELEAELKVAMDSLPNDEQAPKTAFPPTTDPAD